MKLEFALMSDGSHSECYPLMVLRGLAESGKLQRFAAHWGKRKGDCHEIAKALADDLRDAPPMPLNWHWYIGNRPAAGELSWIECDGWAIDTNNGGPERPVLIHRASDYRRITGATNIRLSADSPG